MLTCNFFPVIKAEFPASFMSPSEITLIWRYDAQETFKIIISVENNCDASYLWGNHDIFDCFCILDKKTEFIWDRNLMNQFNAFLLNKRVHSVPRLLKGNVCVRSSLIPVGLNRKDSWSCWSHSSGEKIRIKEFRLDKNNKKHKRGLSFIHYTLYQHQWFHDEPLTSMQAFPSTKSSLDY